MNSRIKVIPGTKKKNMAKIITALRISVSRKSRLMTGSGEKTGDGRKRDEERDVTTIGR